MTVSAITGEWIKAWIDAQRSALDKGMDARRGSATGDPAAAFTDLFQQLNSAFQPWGLAEFGNQIGAFWRNFNPTLAAEGALPGLGPLREQQETLQELTGAMADYQRLSGDIAKVMAKVHSDALDLLGRRSLEQANSGQPIGTFKALYDLWIECGETTYASVAHSDAYCRLQADFCNAGVRVRFCQQQLLERWLKQLDLPTRSELNALHQRVHDLQKRLEASTTTPDKSSKKASARRAKPSASTGSGDGSISRPRPSRKRS